MNQTSPACLLLGHPREEGQATPTPERCDWDHDAPNEVKDRLEKGLAKAL